MGLFSSKEPEVPETISDDRWWHIQKSVAKATPVIDGPWVDPETTRRTNAWKAARGKAADN